MAIDVQKLLDQLGALKRTVQARAEDAGSPSLRPTDAEMDEAEGILEQIRIAVPEADQAVISAEGVLSSAQRALDTAKMARTKTDAALVTGEQLLAAMGSSNVSLSLRTPLRPVGHQVSVVPEKDLASEIAKARKLPKRTKRSRESDSGETPPKSAKTNTMVPATNALAARKQRARKK